VCKVLVRFHGLLIWVVAVGTAQAQKERTLPALLPTQEK